MSSGGLRGLQILCRALACPGWVRFPHVPAIYLDRRLRCEPSAASWSLLILAAAAGAGRAAEVPPAARRRAGRTRPPSPGRRPEPCRRGHRTRWAPPDGGRARFAEPCDRAGAALAPPAALDHAAVGGGPRMGPVGQRPARQGGGGRGGRGVPDLARRRLRPARSGPRRRGARRRPTRRRRKLLERKAAPWLVAPAGLHLVERLRGALEHGRCLRRRAARATSTRSSSRRTRRRWADPIPAGAPP